MYLMLLACPLVQRVGGYLNFPCTLFCSFIYLLFLLFLYLIKHQFLVYPTHKFRLHVTFIQIIYHWTLLGPNYWPFIHQWPYSPFVGPWPLSSSVFFFTQTVGLLGRVISPLEGRYLHRGQHKHRINAHKHINTSSGIRTHDPSVRPIEDCSCLRPHSHRNRLTIDKTLNNLQNTIRSV
jgi:hypothetical protein